MDDRSHFFNFLHTSDSEAEAKWKQARASEEVRGKGGDIYWAAYDKIYAEHHRACLTLLCELWFAQEEGKENG